MRAGQGVEQTTAEGERQRSPGQNKQTGKLITALLTAPQDKCDQRTENNVSVGTRRRGGEGKAIPLQAWKGPEDSTKLSLPDFKTIPLQAWKGPEYSTKLSLPDFKKIPLQAWKGPEYSTKLSLPGFKTIPLQAWKGPEYSTKLSLPDFKTITTRRW